MSALNLFVILYNLLKRNVLSLLTYQMFMSLVNENYGVSRQHKLLKKFVFLIKDTMDMRYKMRPEEVENIWDSLYLRKSVSHRIMSKKKSCCIVVKKLLKIRFNIRYLSTVKSEISKCLGKTLTYQYCS